MSDPAVHVEAEIRYEIRIIRGHSSFLFRGDTVELSAFEDMIVLVRITLLEGQVCDTKVVGIIGGEFKDSIEMLNLRDFLNAGGIIGLHRDLVQRG